MTQKRTRPRAPCNRSWVRARSQPKKHQLGGLDDPSSEILTVSTLPDLNGIDTSKSVLLFAMAPFLYSPLIHSKSSYNGGRQMIPTFLLSLSFLCVCIVPFSREQDPAPQSSKVILLSISSSTELLFSKGNGWNKEEQLWETGQGHIGAIWWPTSCRIVTRNCFGILWRNRMLHLSIQG